MGPEVGLETHQVNAAVVQIQRRQTTRLILSDMGHHTD